MFFQCLKKLVTVSVSAATALTFTSTLASACSNERWHMIMERGSIAVGVKDDYPPWSFRNERGEIVGMEVDIAKRAGAMMGVDVNVVGVQASNRMPLLQSGRIDIILATMSDRLDRREIVGIVQPNYYRSGTNVLVRADAGFRKWEQLEGKPVCAKKGAFYNTEVAESFAVNTIIFDQNIGAKRALRGGICVAWLYDDTAILSEILSGAWDGFEMPFPSLKRNPWGLAVPLEERNCLLGQFMSGVLLNMHRSGELIALEEKWGLEPSAFLAQQNIRFKDPLQN